MQRNYDVRLEQKDNYFVRTYPQWCVRMRRRGRASSLTYITPAACCPPPMSVHCRKEEPQVPPLYL